MFWYVEGVHNETMHGYSLHLCTEYDIFVELLASHGTWTDSGTIVRSRWSVKNVELTEPEVSSNIFKSFFVVFPVAVEIHTTVFTSLKHLKYYKNTIGYKYDDNCQVKILLVIYVFSIGLIDDQPL